MGFSKVITPQSWGSNLEQKGGKMAHTNFESRIRQLERVIVESRKCFRDRDPLEARAWLFRVKVDEDKYGNSNEGNLGQMSSDSREES